MKFLYCADLHGKLKNPISRLDNYSESWLLKIDEIIRLSIDNKCSFVIVNGDVFDSPYISNVLIDEFMDRIERKKISWRIVAGNHDLIGHNWAVSKSSALAHIYRRSSMIDRLITIETEDYFIQGVEYCHGVEENIKENQLITTSKAKFKICIPHALLTKGKFFENTSYIQLKDIKTNFDLILCGHLHTEFDETINKTRFINLSSIGRTAITEQHMPQVAIINTETKDIVKIKLKSAKKADEIFDLSKYEELKANKKDIKEFINSLRDINLQSMDLGQQVVKIGKDNKVEQTIIDYILNKLEVIKNEQ